MSERAPDWARDWASDFIPYCRNTNNEEALCWTEVEPWPCEEYGRRIW